MLYDSFFERPNNFLKPLETDLLKIVFVVSGRKDTDVLFIKTCWTIRQHHIRVTELGHCGFYSRDLLTLPGLSHVEISYVEIDSKSKADNNSQDKAYKYHSAFVRVY